MPIVWSSSHHTELDKQALYDILALRTQVFVVEQKCPYLEVDGLDLVGDSCHLMARDGDALVAYLRLLDPQRNQGDVVIGRVVIAEAARGTGLGHQLMERALEDCQRRWPGLPVYLSAQAHLQKYYGRYGFVPVTEVYLEDDIPHIGMRKAAV
ncbi:GNAT family N-acetyltransferase [Pseudomonas solani]|uniref:Protein ElaA n=1 Tax=Pseudomonas solani TaxID=2731552 RepID=A0AAU7Y2B9_9PSED|nr:MULTISPECIES: GNAT family N-acetyltransferase [Pseudomonas]EQM67744.1 acyltransferase [Pseudomonas alcaligenes OT 69]MBB4817830.1 ElaA protein [Pseudomonas alcaligenes]MDN4148864.1 GNAT family N-acetyltransferase [Pseudomonas tohonis]MCU9950748.1 GNAT family N-acetyltransferase [Pseudomonas sp. PDM13]MDU9411447.1 GNAT family N-acetyltransferase [Pseudomonas sp. zfem005]